MFSPLWHLNIFRIEANKEVCFFETSFDEDSGKNSTSPLESSWRYTKEAKKEEWKKERRREYQPRWIFSELHEEADDAEVA